MKLCLACRTAFSSPGWICPSCGHEPPLRQGHRLFASEQCDNTQGYDPERHALVVRTEKEHFWFRARARMIAWAFGQYFPAATNYLEVGCGTGFVMGQLKESFPNVRMVGSEVLLSGLGDARRNLPDTELLQMDATGIPYQREFSVLGAYDVIEHIEDDRTALRQFANALDEGGGLLLTVPQHPSLWSHHDVRARHLRRYTASELKAKVREAGFQICRITSLYCSVLPLMWWARQSDPGQAANNPGFHLSPSVNRLLDGMVRVECSAVRAGLNLPVGGSLLLIAKKASNAAEAPGAES